MQLVCDFFSHGMKYGMHGKTSFCERNVPFVIYRSRKLTKRQIIWQSANYLSFYKSDHLQKDK